jgi:hypothetical protein
MHRLPWRPTVLAALYCIGYGGIYDIKLDVVEGMRRVNPDHNCPVLSVGCVRRQTWQYIRPCDRQLMSMDDSGLSTATLLLQPDRD